MSAFAPEVVAAVLHHMNDDHPEDSLLISRAFGAEDADAAEMIALDENGGTWSYRVGHAQHEVTVPWPGGTISERPAIRREVVMVYRAACEKLGVEFRQH